MKKEYLIYKLSDTVKCSCRIDNELFTKFGVKRGLRNEDGSGVLVGLTNIGNVVGYARDKDGKLLPTEGKLASIADHRIRMTLVHPDTQRRSVSVSTEACIFIVV